MDVGRLRALRVAVKNDEALFKSPIGTMRITARIKKGIFILLFFHNRTNF